MYNVIRLKWNHNEPPPPYKLKLVVKFLELTHEWEESLGWAHFSIPTHTVAKDTHVVQGLCLNPVNDPLHVTLAIHVFGIPDVVGIFPVADLNLIGKQQAKILGALEYKAKVKV